MSEVIHGNCIEVLPTLGKFDFIFADPPFNIGKDYDNYSDTIEDYWDWCEQWIALCWDHLEPNGVLCLHGTDTLAEIFLCSARRLKMNRIAWINWHYRFGQCTRTNWIDARCHCLVYARGQGHTWRPEAVLVPSDRAEVYGDKRVALTPNGGQRLPGTIWGVPSDGAYWGRVQGNNMERRPLHNNQLPEVYLKRLILAYTNPGDKVLDPFGGSGTTITVAHHLSRVGTTIELSNLYCQSIINRVKEGMVR